LIRFITILFLLLSVQCRLLSQDYWLKQNSPTALNLTTCFFTDSLNGWIGGDSGLILHTSDKGISWNRQNSRVRNSIVSLYFVNKNVGFGISLEFDFTPPNYIGSRILSTTNGGISWDNYLFQDTNIFLNTIYFLDTLNGFTGGSDGKIYYTSNSGNLWTQSTVDSGLSFTFPVDDIKFYDPLTGFAAGGAFDIAGMIWKTTNGGLTWNNRIVGAEPVTDIFIIDSLNIIAVGGDFEYGASNVKTTNSGANWIYQEFGIFGIANSIDFRTESEAWISLGIVDSFLISTNGGITWRLTGTPNSARIYDITFTDPNNGWAVGVDGVILKYNTNVIGVHEDNNYIPETITLFQNYPNPFNPVTVINYDLNIKNGGSNFVSLKIYDILGREAATLVDQDQTSGSYNISFDGSNFQSGIYYYRISVLDKSTNLEFTQSKKMVILK